MKENIDRMRVRHKKEIENLQSKCKHKKVSDWIPNMWAPGHIDGEVKICENCNKIIERKNESSIITKKDLLTPLSEFEEKHNITETRNDMEVK